MKKPRKTLHLFLTIFLFLFHTEAKSFEAFEHIWIGETAKLEFPDDDDQYYSNYPYQEYLEILSKSFQIEKPFPQYLELGETNPYKISFGEILALAGDYFSLLEGSISSANAQLLIDQPGLRFRRAFSTFFPDDDRPKSLQRDYLEAYGSYANLLVFQKSSTRYVVSNEENPFKPRENIPMFRELFKNEFESIVGLIAQNPLLFSKINSSAEENPKTISKKNSPYSPFQYVNQAWVYVDDIHTNLLKASSIFHQLKDLYIKSNTFFETLAVNNFDHFGAEATETYKIGHQVALEEALKASKTSDPKLKRKYLNYAYAMDAFALHFLSDTFSAGHIRTPRFDIYEKSYHAKAAGLCAKAMHDEDGYYGLKVKNIHEKWIAYGDSSYFDDRSENNRVQLRLTVQASVNEIWEIFNNGNATSIHGPEHFQALKLIPTLDEDSFPSLFKLAEGEIKVRKSYGNIYETQYQSLGSTDFLTASLFPPHWKKSLYDFRSIINHLPNNAIIQITGQCKSAHNPSLSLSSIQGFLADLSSFQFTPKNFEAKPQEEYVIINRFDYRKAIRECRAFNYSAKNESINDEVSFSYISPKNASQKEVTQINIFDKDGSLFKLNDNKNSHSIYEDH